MSERVKKVRKHKDINMSQSDFGKCVGVAAAAISKIEKGENSLTDQMILAICREFNVNEDWLRTGEGGDGAMFELYDDKELSALFKRYSMDYDSKDIIFNYVKLHPEKRKALGGLIKEFAGAVLSNDINSAKGELFNELLNHFPGQLSEHQTEKIAGKIHGAFNKFLPSATQHDPPPVAPSRLAEFQHTTDIEANLEREATAFAEKVKAEYIHEKRQERLASSLESSDLKPNKKIGNG